MAARYTLKVLGGASIEGPTGPMSGRSAQRHRVALLALLAATPSGMSRDKLVAMLWPERDRPRARHALSDSIYRVNKALGREAVVAAGNRDLWLDTDALRTDLTAFLRALDEKRWERAVEIHEGPFLDGFHLPGSAEFEAWVDRERQRVADLYARALESLAEDRAEAGDPEAATAAWRRRAALDPYDSRVAVRLMQALEAAGNPAGALRHARIHAESLEREFGTGPNRDVAALAEHIRERLRVPDEEAQISTGGSDGSSRKFERSDPTTPEPVLSSSSPEPASPPSEAESDGRAEATALDRGGRISVKSPHPPPGVPRSRLWRRIGMVLAGALAVILTGTLIPEVETPSIAVLAFEDLSPDANRRWFADGIAEEVAQALDEMPELRVIALQSSFVFRDRPLDVRRIADTLDVTYIVDGSVREGGDSAWISPALIDGSTGFYLWSDTYATALSPERLRSIQNRIARDVATTLSLRVEDEPEVAHDPVTDSSYDAYLEGRFHLRRFQSGASRDPQEILHSLDLFRRVVDREPGWADGWAALGEAHHWAAYRGFEPGRNRAESKRALKRALLLDPDHPQANASLGYILHRLDHDYEGAKARFQRALDLDSDQYWHCGYSLFLLWSGRYEDAVEATRYAEGRDPMFRPLTGLRASSNRCAGRFEDAVRLAERVLSVAPDVGGAWRDLALSLERTGRVETALERLAAAEEPRAYLDLIRVLLLARSGRTDEAESLLRRTDVEEAVQWAADTYSSRQITAEPLHAAALVALGRSEAAIEVLRRGLDRDSGTLLYDRCYTELRSLEGDARYQELLRRTGVPGR